MNFTKLTKEKLDINSISELVTDERCGAISLFVGTTRDNFDDKPVLSLKYEAYDKMADKMLNKICDDIREKWPDVLHIALYHRLGLVPIKESSVVIAISSPHRQESLEAVQFAIDELKRTVPIWKKEIYGGEYEAHAQQPQKRLKRAKSHMNFDICCPISNDTIVSKNLLQIRADETEIKRRIASFIGRKREEINSSNVYDFITDTKHSGDDDNEMRCARVNSTVYRIKGSKGHLKVHRVKNESGPQTTNYKGALDKLMENNSPIKIKPDPDMPSKTLSSGIEERISNAETHLNIMTTNVTTKTVFERLKAIEEKILYLETLSPEYSHFLNKSIQNVDNMPNIKKERKKKYTPDELEELLKNITNQSES
ncbi:molybdopterin synthase catalytic subunit [Contarinia nasturtii]|uniref:molybdopterin synthase catalytic subunit n=1 Tax=Contarinia nasturtii TaxID=265458 RepID=UPI0012D45D1C|nr:molybdopterin synthase catalytic subunit [Contarinia nasturtii]